MSRIDKRGLRLGAGLVAVLGGLAMVIGSFLPWIHTATEDGGSTGISGWGTISGASEMAGFDLNDILAMDGLGTYRPGALGAVFGGLAMVAGVVLAAVTPGRRAAARGESTRPPHRITASALVLCALAGMAWGIFRALAPGDAHVLLPGEGTAGIGPWITAVGGLLVLAVAVAVLTGRLDPSDEVAPRHPGIQPG